MSGNHTCQWVEFGASCGFLGTEPAPSLGAHGAFSFSPSAVFYHHLSALSLPVTVPCFSVQILISVYLTKTLICNIKFHNIYHMDRVQTHMQVS